MTPRLQQLHKLLTLDERDTFVLYGIATEHLKAGDHAAARAFFDRCLAVDPAYCYAYYFKARSLAATGDKPAAIATIDAGLAAAQLAGDGKALGELTTLKAELS